MKITYSSELITTPFTKYERFLNETSGIYFLYNNDDLIYIGRSKHCLLRINAHSADKVFTKVIIWPIKSLIDIAILEPYLINAHKPPLNKEFIEDEVANVKIENIATFESLAKTYTIIKSRTIFRELENEVVAIRKNLHRYSNPTLIEKLHNNAEKLEAALQSIGKIVPAVLCVDQIP